MVDLSSPCSSCGRMIGGAPKYTSVWVNNREEETKLVDEGYTLVRTDPREGASLYRKVVSAAAQLIGHD